MGVDLTEDSPAKVMGLEKVAELADRRLVWYRLVAEIYPNKSPHGFHIVERFFGSGVAEVEPTLQEMDPKHPFQPYGRSAPSRLGVVGFYEGAKFLPGNDLFHLGQKLLAPCGFREAPLPPPRYRRRPKRQRRWEA